MLEELHVANLGLLEDARIEPGSGLVVVTGETGAGKTMLLGALQLLGGGAARRDRVGPTGDELLVEGRFLVADGERVAARRVTREGRSKAYEDGSMVTAARLGEVFGPLMEIVAQHDALTLARPAGVLDLVDGALTERGRERLNEYNIAWAELSRLRSEQAELGSDRRGLERDLMAVRQQAEEIGSARLAIGEEAELEVKLDRLRNAESLTEGLNASYTALVDDGGAIDRVGNVIAELRRLVAMDPSLEDLHARAVAASDTLSELSADLAGIAAGLEHDSESLEAAERRIGLINGLLRKYGETVADVVVFGEAAEARAAAIQRRLTSAENLDEDIAKATKIVDEAARHLGKSRGDVARKLASAATLHLMDLGMDDPLIRLDIEEVEPGPRGGDRAVLLFASERSLAPGPVARIASGGELSRLVLSLRLAAGAGDVPIVAFDEIDAGVGGTTALAMGEKLARLARGRQVLCVSHLPQIAAFADTHIVVSRVGSTAVANKVSGSDRSREIARMLSGLGDTSSGIDHADDLLRAAAARLSATG